MSELLQTSLPTPTKQRFAATFRVVSRFSFWIQLALASTSGIALTFAVFSRSLSVATENAAIGLSIFLAVVGVLLAVFRIFWAFRGRVLARRLQSPERELHPRKEEVIQVLKIGLIASFIGMLLAFIASEVSAISILSQALAVPQGVAVYQQGNVIRSLDILVILANVNLIGTHLVGSLTSLGLLEWID
ncbi:MAG: hypothetical protein CLLPBCKN_000313 [Chroococcidiopsis cubana SAG 39.79]|jgi:hypothetical protein|uniref:DUF3611 family protein n=1 Tax=Chroococcidiopsis cubana SAG 39.79 TaxID=388085 RepID=A0AB37UH07_9CYAN|nr:DUF3611 family protein [Chroococcidiopsis cubana]MDZ4870925.1 hypothetical protein [Chroococcidiopsis cubana SAG 39.79]PSB62963.1 hypothetical protein C7B79_15860 [Chroococcidiopsis cubana CCALA 043]RUT10409.1 hypothetical protein DSM107010_42970 [Chroococcidiopsis cubana SAG 39.79]